MKIVIQHSKKHILILSAIACLVGTRAQDNFVPMILPSSSPVAALGWHFSSIPDSSFETAIANPSLLRKNNHNDVLLNYSSFVNSYSNVVLGYARDFENIGMFSAYLQYSGYGKVDAIDEHGTYLGYKASAYNMLFNIGWGRTLIPGVSIGANLKYILGGFDGEFVNGMAVDVSGSYVAENKLFASSLIFRNVGFSFNKTTNIEGYGEIPFEILVATSYKLPHAPIRLCLTIQQMQRWNLANVDFDIPDPLTGRFPNKFSAFGDNLLRHVVPGAEIFLFRGNIIARLSYNYHRGRELAPPSRSGASGLSFGFGLKVHNFYINYAHQIYHPAWAPNHISVSTNLSKWF